MRSSDDLTTRARIRDAAVTRFARDGFGVPLRVIATDAGVSPALVIHHFGSKDGLRAACDEHVLARSLLLEAGVFENADPELFRSLLGNLRSFGEPVAYLLRSMLAGGDVARTILERTAAATEAYLDSAVTAGIARPSRDPAGRARYLTYMGLGMLVTAFLAAEPGEPDDDADPYAHVARLLETLVVPHLELMTQGLITDAALLSTAADWASKAATTTSDHPTTKRDP